MLPRSATYRSIGPGRSSPEPGSGASFGATQYDGGERLTGLAATARYSPDRIAWHKAVEAKYPWQGPSRVRIYANSAGRQNAPGALLFHSDFYDAAVSSAGCHDNRMDKIWWNEQWMGWPLGPHCLASSNLVHAHKLKGKLLLSVGELGDNVDPASTMQVVNALIKAEKTFDLIVLPSQRHTAGGPYGDRKRYDFSCTTSWDWSRRTETLSI